MKYQREITAAVLIPAVLLILVKGPLWAFSILVALASGVALFELYAIIRAAGWTVPRAAGFVLFFGILFFAHVTNVAVLLALVGGTLVLLPALVMFSSPPVHTLLGSSASSVFATLYVAAGGAAMIGLRALGWAPVLFLLAIIWAGDSAAYYVGRRWGRKPLAPVVSPKKTWAGFWGQVAAGAILGFMLSFGRTAAGAGSPAPSPWPTALFLAVLGAVLSAVAIVGDLVESTFKRSCDIKDSGGLLPGHGGLLDRLDSLLYASPVFLFVLLGLEGRFR